MYKIVYKIIILFIVFTSISGCKDNSINESEIASIESEVSVITFSDFQDIAFNSFKGSEHTLKSVTLLDDSSIEFYYDSKIDLDNVDIYFLIIETIITDYNLNPIDTLDEIDIIIRDNYESYYHVIEAQTITNK